MAMIMPYHFSSVSARLLTSSTWDCLVLLNPPCRPMGFQPRRTDSENRAIRQSAWYCDTSQSTAKVVVGKGVSGTFLVRDSKNKQTGVVEKHVLVINDHGKIVSFQIRIQVRSL